MKIDPLPEEASSLATAALAKALDPVKQSQDPELAEVIERLVANSTAADNGCREWKGPRNAAGYGQIYYKGKNWRVHRLIFTIVNGPIPAGYTIDHTCVNPPCFLPAHLECVTIGENIRRMHSRLQMTKYGEDYERHLAGQRINSTLRLELGSRAYAALSAENRSYDSNEMAIRVLRSRWLKREPRQRFSSVAKEKETERLELGRRAHFHVDPAQGREMVSLLHRANLSADLSDKQLAKVELGARAYDALRDEERCSRKTPVGDNGRNFRIEQWVEMMRGRIGLWSLEDIMSAEIGREAFQRMSRRPTTVKTWVRDFIIEVNGEYDFYALPRSKRAIAAYETSYQVALRAQKAQRVAQEAIEQWKEPYILPKEPVEDDEYETQRYDQNQELNSAMDKVKAELNQAREALTAAARVHTILQRNA